MRVLVTSIVLLLGIAAAGSAAAPASSPEGYWLTAKRDGIIEILRCPGAETLCGRLAWFRLDPKDANPQALDLRNPDPARRDRPLCGLIFMNGFRLASPGSWEDGAIYDPQSGKTYQAMLKLQPDGTLSLRGYIGISLIGRSEVWTRYTEKLPSCPTR